MTVTEIRPILKKKQVSEYQKKGAFGLSCCYEVGGLHGAFLRLD